MLTLLIELMHMHVPDERSGGVDQVMQIIGEDVKHRVHPVSSWYS